MEVEATLEMQTSRDNTLEPCIKRNQLSRNNRGKKKKILNSSPWTLLFHKLKLFNPSIL